MRTLTKIESDDLSVVIAGRRLTRLPAFCEAMGSFLLHGRKIFIALIHTRRPSFVPHSDAHRDKVLLRVRAFSCNYRDRSIALEASSALAKVPDMGYTGIGSEFAATVEAVGSRVTALAVGDQVIADANYSDPENEHLPRGIPTNGASLRFLILSARQVIRVPANMPPAIAASFTIGPQTSYGMLRKLNLKPGARALVTAVHSNTSLFVVQVLREHGIETFATSSSTRHKTTLHRLGVRRLFALPSTKSGSNWDAVNRFCEKYGKFDAVIDPFFDLHIHHAIRLIRTSGQYITCGLLYQHQAMTGRNLWRTSLHPTLSLAIEGNISLVGNCLGTTADLEHAIEAFTRNRMEVIIDSTFRPAEMAAFFQQSFNSTRRFGKVVMLYD